MVSAAILAHALAAFLPLKSPLNSNCPKHKNRIKNEEKPPKQAVFLRKVVRVTGFEPAASCSQSRRATNCATPGYHAAAGPVGKQVLPDGLPSQGGRSAAITKQYNKIPAGMSICEWVRRKIKAGSLARTRPRGSPKSCRRQGEGQRTLCPGSGAGNRT